MSKESSVVEQTASFDLSGGDLCLDFANTVDNRLSQEPDDLLPTYASLVAWAQQAQLINSEQAVSLLEQATKDPEEAEAVLSRAMVVRETLFRIFEKLAEAVAPDEKDLTMLNEELGEALAHARIVRAEDTHFAWGWTSAPADLNAPLWPIVRAAADLLTSSRLHMLRICAADDCGWLFLDTSKNQTRRWCNMRSCGNRAKARRHLARKKVAT